MSADNKKDKHCTRLIECRLCLKSWHAFCVGYQLMNVNEFLEKSKTFVCNKCNFFIERVSDVVTDKLSTIIKSHFSELETKLSTGNIAANNITMNDQQSTKIPDILTDEKPGDTTSDSLNKTATSLTHSNDNEIRTSQNIKLKTKVSNSTEQEQNQINKLYLCSIEKDLSISDISFILNDAELDITGININETHGNFKNKKFVELDSTEKVKLFKFKLAFGKSSLHNTWFVRNTPPKVPVNIERSDKTNYYTVDKPKNHQNPASIARQTDKKKEEYPKNNYSHPHSNMRKSNNSKPLYSDITKLNMPRSQYDTRQHNYQDYIHKEDFQGFLEQVLGQLLRR